MKGRLARGTTFILPEMIDRAPLCDNGRLRVRLRLPHQLQDHLHQFSKTGSHLPPALCIFPSDYSSYRRL
jgi:hypothetical protein